MKNVLVTGGSGFIGSHVVVELIAAGMQPIIIDNFANSEHFIIDRLKQITGQEIICYAGEFQDTSLLSEVMAAYPIDSVIHFAAYKAVGESVAKPLKYYQNNVAGLITLLTFLSENRVQDIVFSSSCTVYGQPDSLPITESTPVKPANSPYGNTKQIGEAILRDLTTSKSGTKALALRYFNPIGAHPSGLIGELPRGIPSNLVPFVMQTAAGLRDKLTVFGNDYKTPDGSCIRDYIHVVDLARAHVKALQHLSSLPSGSFDCFNIGTGSGNSVLEVIEAFETVTGQKVAYEIGPRRDGDVTAIYASVDKARDVLGWTATYTLEEALRDGWLWQQQLQPQEPGA